MTYRHAFELFVAKFAIAFLVILTPYVAQASFFSLFSQLLASSDQSAAVDTSLNAQNIDILQSNTSPDGGLGTGGGDIAIADGNALDPQSGPLGTNEDVSPSDAQSHQISLYTVRGGDSVYTIAKMYGISSNTIIWANNLAGKTLKEGQVLVILPVSGALHTVTKGETVSSIAKKYKADAQEIAQFNGIDVADQLAVGQTLTIPDADLPTPISNIPSTIGSKFYRTSSGAIIFVGTGVTAKAHDTNGPNYDYYYMRPVNGVKTQGLHGYNAVDIGAPIGTPIFAAAPGTIIVSRMGGWNGGYGNYVVISHPNGTETLYAHMKETAVSVGEQVARGQIIGYVGMTGEATGPHLHFEVRGAHNPFQ